MKISESLKNSRDGLSKQAEAVLSVELTNLENSIKDAIAKNNFLILKDVKNKARYQDYQTKFDQLGCDIIESRMLLAAENESDRLTIDETNVASTTLISNYGVNSTKQISTNANTCTEVVPDVSALPTQTHFK